MNTLVTMLKLLTMSFISQRMDSSKKSYYYFEFRANTKIGNSQISKIQKNLGAETHQKVTGLIKKINGFRLAV